MIKLLLPLMFMIAIPLSQTLHFNNFDIFIDFQYIFIKIYLGGSVRICICLYKIL